MKAPCTPDVVEELSLGHIAVRLTRVGHGTGFTHYHVAFAPFTNEIEDAPTYGLDDLDDLARAVELARSVVTFLQTGRGLPAFIERVREHEGRLEVNA